MMKANDDGDGVTSHSFFLFLFVADGSLALMVAETKGKALGLKLLRQVLAAHEAPMIIHMNNRSR